MTVTIENGRLGNQIIRNVAVSFIAMKHNLFVKYVNHNSISQLGIELFVGKNDHKLLKKLTDDNYFEILNMPTINFNLNPNDNYFQTKEIMQFIYDWLHQSHIQNNIIQHNPYKTRYNNNNDLFVHVRLGDVIHFNPGFCYYDKIIAQIKQTCMINNVYIASDSFNHEIVCELQKKYNARHVLKDEVETIQFGSTCKHIVLSHGSFSAIIGYLSFYSDVYYKKYEKNKMWYGDMFSVNTWHMVE